MARTALAVQEITRSGLTPVLTAANAGGHSIVNDDFTYIEVVNAGGSACTVTVQTPGTVDGLAVAERAVTVAATSGRKRIGPFPKHIYDQSDGTVYVDFSTVTSVTVGAFKLGT
ncbi:MAG: hypothetical protein H6637_05455 [Ardenticatenales bacterium]|nr:hypothetical protein [Ardenticatenales bacterium]